jgi:LPS O-antigen subunit length determinant protein (WzzB/FepE family)
MKKKNHIYHEDEIDLINLFKIIWDDKIKILIFTIISFLIGFGYSYQIPNNNLYSLVIKKSEKTEFYKLLSIELMINSNQPMNTNLSDQIILNKFVSELNDYEELSINLEKIKKVRENIAKLPIEKQAERLFQYAKSLSIGLKKDPNKRDEINYILNFQWDNTDEAKKILKDTIDLTLKNLEKKIYKVLEQSLEFKSKMNKNRDKIRLDFLIEQSAIAKELNILDNQIENINLSQSSVSLNINTADIAYYLRGFKAIDKEIELIKSRNYEIYEFIKQEINFLKEEEIRWIDYNIYSLQSESLKDTKLIKIISILLGLIVGVIFVLISNVIQSQTVSKKTI